MMKALIALLLLSTSLAHAEPLLQVHGNDTRIVLYSEPCALPAVVNLPHRAEWTTRGETFAGCWAINVFGYVVMYFDDRTAAAIPAKLFAVVREV